MLNIPDRISTLELSKLWIRRALEEIEAEHNKDQQPEDQQSEADNER